MMRPITILVVSAALLSACGAARESRLNPFNWFGRGAPEAVTAETGAANPLLPRRAAVSVFRRETEERYDGRLVGELTEVLVERRPGGAILRATGVADVLGSFDVRLVPVPEETDAGTLTFELRAVPAGPRGGSAQARTLTAALALSDAQLREVRTIRVKSARNVLSSRR